MFSESQSLPGRNNQQLQVSEKKSNLKKGRIACKHFLHLMKLGSSPAVAGTGWLRRLQHQTGELEQAFLLDRFLIAFFILHSLVIRHSQHTSNVNPAILTDPLESSSSRTSFPVRRKLRILRMRPMSSREDGHVFRSNLTAALLCIKNHPFSSKFSAAYLSR